MSEAAGAPVCYRHPGRQTWVRCTRCERPICPDCMHAAAVGHQCPECVAQGRRTQRQGRTAFGGGPAGQRGYVTKALLATNILVMLASVLSAGGGGLLGGGFAGLGGDVTPLMAWGGVFGRDDSPESIAAHLAGIYHGEYYRLVAAMFLHFGLLHLGLNMWALWAFGRYLEAALGPIRYLALYLLAGLGGNVAAYLFAPGALTVGASGAVFGLFGALFIVLRRLGNDTSSVLTVLGINLLFTFAIPQISKAGHIGGLVVGALAALALAYAPRRHRTLIQAGACALLFGLLMVAAAIGTLRLSG
ncbi:rhomboid family intramembrane serine protease [Pilimelia terevasa]|uniref:Rhomboid family intramembrane serine protease n=1 Tax=Pilimelia terevasa TaxID=53372 RepID=A0A8J3BRB8_9ACTN|nr:rhomboid family intramembrane serine protease [Pilimelia terevasa]GGK32632.1 rhomboid family intramembrane serine protease [Pilimelia terevasa]